MSRPVWVLDTNVVVSAALTAGGTCDQVLRAAIENDVRLAWSAGMLAEYRAVLLRPKFGFSKPVIAALLAAFAESEQVRTLQPAPELPDRDDEVFLATALATTDKILVTGNDTHFPVDRCLPVKILSPRAALESIGLGE